MRYIILGAGAVGGPVGHRLHALGADVCFIARGPHGAAMAARGLTLRTPSVEATRRIPTVAHPAELSYDPDKDLVILAVKSQDTRQAVEDLLSAGAAGVPVACAQNGVDNESVVAESFAATYGIMVWMPGVHLEPGVVELYANEPGAVFRIGRFPTGDDDRAHGLARDLSASGFDAEPVPDVMRWKYGKLLLNGGNLLDALCAHDDLRARVYYGIVAEGARCLRAAGIDYAEPATLMADMRSRTANADIAGMQRPGGSTWQSAHRGRPLEAAALSGAIARIGREAGESAPLSESLVALAEQAARGTIAPRSIPSRTLLARAGVAEDDLPCALPAPSGG